MQPAPITVIILTCNEAANLAAALDSVRGWAREVWVVDSFSADRTVDLALARAGEGVRVVQHPFADYSAQWNWALDRLPLATEWVLKLDADERATPEFKAEFDRLSGDPANPNAAYFFRRTIVFMGRPLYWGGLSGNWDIRIWKHAHGRFEDRSCNEHLIVQGGPVGKMQARVEHHDSKDLASWVDKQNRYTSFEAQTRIRGEHESTRPRLFGSKLERTNWLREVYFRLPLHNLLFFIFTGILRGAWLDGLRGLHYAFLRSFFFYLNDLKVLEYRTTGKIPQPPTPSLGRPHPQVAGSEIQKLVDGRQEFNALAPGVRFPWIEQARDAARS